MTALHSGRIFDGARFHDDTTIVLDGTRVARLERGRARDAESLGDDTILSAGFVDLQINGGGGVLFNDATNLEGLRAIAAAHASRGTTTLLPTLITTTRDHMRKALGAAADAAGVVPGIAGLHFEGPFINVERRGIHPADRVVGIAEDDLAWLCRPFPGTLLLTVAPERVPLPFLSRLHAAGRVLFAGHSDAPFDVASAGFEGGIAGVTHLFNAMSQFGSREPGLVGATLANEHVGASVICDGLHAHPASLRVAFDTLGRERLFLISDAMPTAASETVSFRWNDETITLKDNRLATADGRLAGAHLTMAEAVARAVRLCNLSLRDALTMATATPARFARLTDRGRLAKGYAADLVALDPQLEPRAVWQDGVRLI